MFSRIIIFGSSLPELLGGHSLCAIICGRVPGTVGYAADQESELRTMPAILFAKPECVFIRIPKTGSTSIVYGLLRTARRRQKIVSARDYPIDWGEKFSFAFVRDPHQ
jgi:hypothetical protein